jgi:glutaminase
LDAKGNSVRGVRLCRSLSEQLGLHFLNVSRDGRATLRAVYEPCDKVRVYEAHGDLLFSGAEQVLRTVDRDRDAFDAVILDVSRVDDIDDAARALLSGMTVTLRAEGKHGYLVDPEGIVIRNEPEFEESRYLTLDDAVAAARASTRADFAR